MNPVRIDPLILLDRLQQLWNELPEMACQGKCQNCCGPIDMSPGERMLVRRRGVEIQPFTEERVTRWQADEKVDSEGQSLYCAALDMRTGGCRVYDVRPTVCRLWGASDAMPCEHGCRPVELLSDTETMIYMVRSMTVGGRFTQEEADHALANLLDPKIAAAVSRYMRDPHHREEAREAIAERRNA